MDDLCRFVDGARRDLPLIEYRTFTNTDPPKLTELWRFGGLGPGAATEVSNDALDMLVLSEPYFDRKGMILATSGTEVVGFVHAGFGANKDQSGISKEAAVISAVLVHPDFRRQGIGRQLVNRAEAYCLEAGARDIHAGESGTRNPFYLGLYGGAECAGFLDSDATAAPFFTALGYAPVERHLIFRRDITAKKDPFDPRGVALKRTMKFGVMDHPPDAPWWWMTRHGRFESLTFALVPNDGSPPAAFITCWGMELHAASRGQRTVGLTDLIVSDPCRRKGYAKVLLSEVIRRLREDLVTQLEATVRDDNEATIALLRGLSFQQQDAGTVFRRTAGGPSSSSS